MATMDELKERVKQLENELEAVKKGKSYVVRDKINTMSSEVVDSNPYRCVINVDFQRKIYFL